MPSMLPLLYAAESPEISDASFDAATAIINKAFEKACQEMRPNGHLNSVKDIIAKRLIVIASGGECDPEKMSEAALVSLGLKPNRFTI
jgi:hypothetical protein